MGFGAGIVLMMALGAPEATPLSQDFDPVRAAEQAQADGAPADAAALWAQAYDNEPTTRLLLAMARALSQTSGRCTTGRSAYARFALACSDCPQREEAQRESEQIDEQCLAALTIGAAKDVFVDGEPASGPVLKLAPGPHRVGTKGRARTVCLTSRDNHEWIPAKPKGKQTSTSPKALALALEYEAFEHLSTKAWCEAVHTLDLAHRAVPNPGYLFNIAQAYERWPGHCGAAIRGFRAYLNICRDCAQTAIATKRRDHLLEKCGAQVIVRGTKTTDRVRIDDQPYSAKRRWAPGPHILRIDQVSSRVTRHFYIEPSLDRTFVLAPPLPTITALPIPTEIITLAPLASEASRSPGPIILGAISAGALIAGLAGGAIAVNARADLDSVEASALQMPSQALSNEARDLANTGRGARAILWGGLGAATTTAVAALVWWLYDSEPNP